MTPSLAIVGAGVSGLTTAVVLAESGYRVSIFAKETGQRTTSAVAAAMWYPYDAEPADKVIAWALETYQVLLDLARDKTSGVSSIELLSLARRGEIPIPDWANSLGARLVPPSVGTGLRPVPDRAQRGGDSFAEEISTPFSSAFAMEVPLVDTTIYLEYLAARLRNAGGKIHDGVYFETLAEIGRDFDLVINCAGIGARTLVPDLELEPHRGQVVIVPKLSLSRAVVCDDPPLMYAIPRTNDCVFGGTNEVSDNCDADPAATSSILAECSRTLNIAAPKILAERVGLRPFRKSGVCLCSDRLRDGRPVIHNYGHGGAGFTLSWGCAREVLELVRKIR